MTITIKRTKKSLIVDVDAYSEHYRANVQGALVGRYIVPLSVIDGEGLSASEIYSQVVELRADELFSRRHGLGYPSYVRCVGVHKYGA